MFFRLITKRMMALKFSREKEEKKEVVALLDFSLAIFAALMIVLDVAHY